MALPLVKVGPHTAQAMEEKYRQLTDADKEYLALLYCITHRNG
jgi:hypothetical protein